MYVEYKTQKDLPCKELYELFLAVGWATEDNWKRTCSKMHKYV